MTNRTITVVAWREMLTIVHPDTLVRWHRRLCRLVWRAKSRPRRRPAIPSTLQNLIADMAIANRTWGEERIAAELRLKLGVTVSPRTVRRYIPGPPRRRGHQPTESWTAFLHNHAGSVVACDFFIVVTATFRRLYLFVLLDIATREVLHWNVTDTHRRMDDSAVLEWCTPRREISVCRPRPGCHLRACRRRRTQGDVAPGGADAAARAGGECPLRRFIGTIRRECLDWIIPRDEQHLGRALADWMVHYRERPHSALGPGLPGDPSRRATVTGHDLPPGHRVVARPRFGGLHRDYRLERVAA